MSILVLKQRLAKNLHKEHIALGDFNLDYESCEGSDVSKPHVEKWEKLLIAMQRWKIEQMIPTKTAIYKESIRKSTIDLIFVTDLLLKSLIFCGIVEKFDYYSDYRPILSQ